LSCFLYSRLSLSLSRSLFLPLILPPPTRTTFSVSVFILLFSSTMDSLESTSTEESSRSSRPSASPISRSRSVSPQKNVSPVWRYFKKLEDGGRLCTLCSPSTKVYSKNTSTTSLQDHLLSAHPKLTRDLLQPSIDEALAAPIHGEQKNELDNALIGWIIEDFQAFNVTDSSAFREFLALLNPRSDCFLFFCFLLKILQRRHKADLLCFLPSLPRYRLLDRHTVSDRIVRGLGEETKEIRKVLQEATSRICCTTDGWTSVSLHSFIAVTAHFISADWKMRGLTISFQEMPASHTGENLSNRLLEVAKKFGIEEKISSFVSDNANNAMNGVTLAAEALSTDLSKVLPLRCLAHVLHLTASAGFESLEGPMAKVKAIVSKLRSSNTLLSTLHSFCVPNGETPSKPLTATPTRWNSTLAMLESVSGMRKSLASIKEHIPSLTAEEWKALDQIQVLLTPFSVATAHLSGSGYCTLSSGGFIVNFLRYHLEDNEHACPAVGVPAMIEKLKKYQKDIEAQALLPSFFDPRYLHQLSDAEKITAIGDIKTKIKKPSRTNESKSQSAPKAKAFHDMFSPNIQALPDTLDKATRGFPELEAYMQIYSLDHKENPLEWWSSNEERFPNLAVLARDHLAMLATTVPSEATFSAAGNMITKKRNQLASETVEGLMIAHSWKRYQRSLREGK